MNSKSIFNLNSELRFLPASSRHQLVGLLDLNENWKLLAAVIRNPDRPSELLLKTTDILLLEEQRKRPGGSPSNALLEHWGTYGRKRHTFAELIFFLEDCGLNRAATLIRNSLHNCAEIEPDFFAKTNQIDPLVNWSDLPEYTSCSNDCSNIIKPSAPHESLISFTTDGHEDQIFPSFQSCNQNNPIRFNYRDIQLATENFSSLDISQGGTKLGEGSFGVVFRCNASLLNSEQLNSAAFVAVKRFKEVPLSDLVDQQKSGQFVSELNLMYRFQHPNLVRLFGYSNDGPSFCIVTEYLENGSLQDFLTSSNAMPFTLSFVQRFQIALDVAKALVYLHNYAASDQYGNRLIKPFIHRDIKSANIFLDYKFGARLGDLGLVRQGSTCNTSTTVVTATIIGTSVYMAPEAFRGDVSVKIDTFSFGVVLFELLTGMLAFDSSREESDIISYIDSEVGDEFDMLFNKSSVSKTRKQLLQFVNKASEEVDHRKMNIIIDQMCAEVNPKQAHRLIILAKCCIEPRKKNRPTMDEVYEVLKSIANCH